MAARAQQTTAQRSQSKELCKTFLWALVVKPQLILMGFALLPLTVYMVYIYIYIHLVYDILYRVRTRGLKQGPVGWIMEEQCLEATLVINVLCPAGTGRMRVLG